MGDHDPLGLKSAGHYIRRFLDRGEPANAVRRFKAAIAILDYERIGTEGEFLAEFNALMNTLRHELALASIGIPLD